MAKHAASLGRIAGLVMMAVMVSYQGSAQPRPELIFNAASGYIDHPEGPAELAQGSLFAVTGRSLGPDVLRNAGFPLPLELGGVSVRITVGNTTSAALMVEAGPRHLTAILPSGVPLGDGVLSVSYRGETSAPSRVRVVRRAFGIFEPVHNIGSEAGEADNSFTSSARHGQVAVLWGTGLGPAAGDESSGPVPGVLETGAQVLIGNQVANVLYAGRSGCCAGLDQIVFEVPSGLEGCRVPIALRFSDGDTSRNVGSMSIAAAGGTCSDPHGLSAADRERLRVMSSLKIGSFRLSPGNGRADFYQVNDRGVGAESASRWRGQILPPFGTCIAERLPRGAIARPAATGAPSSPPQVVGLNAGPFLNIAGPRGTTQWRQEQLGYNAPKEQSVPFGPGDYAVDNAAGGPDIRPFRAMFRVPPLSFQPSFDSSSVSRGDGLTIAWDGSGLAQAYVIIYGGSRHGSVRPRPCTRKLGERSFASSAARRGGSRFLHTF